MFNFFKKIRQKDKLHGFLCGGIAVTVVQFESDSGKSIIYTCSFFDFTINFEYSFYANVDNPLGFSTITYKNTVICKETHEIRLNRFVSSDYLKPFFQRSIHYAKTLNTDHLNVILPFFETKAFHFTKGLEIGLSSTYQHGSVYNVSLMQENAPYNDYLNRNCNKGWTKFNIVTYKNNVFDCLYNNEFTYLSRQNQLQISQINKISAQISSLIDDSKLTLSTFDRKEDKIFFNSTKKTALLYRVINSEKEYHGSHMDTVDELYNFISLHIFWLVDFDCKNTELNIFVYDDNNTFVKEYSHSMETKFKDELLDFDYYKNFFNKTLDELIHCYYPSRKMIELLDSGINIEDFDGFLTEDEYKLFKMITI